MNVHAMSKLGEAELCYQYPTSDNTTRLNSYNTRTAIYTMTGNDPKPYESLTDKVEGLPQVENDRSLTRSTTSSKAEVELIIRY